MSSRSATRAFRLKGVPKQAAEWVAETIRGFETPPPLPSCDELGSGFWVDVEYLAGVGTPLTAGAKLSFGVLERGLAIFSELGYDKYLRATSVPEGQPVIAFTASELAEVRERFKGVITFKDQ